MESPNEDRSLFQYFIGELNNYRLHESTEDTVELLKKLLQCIQTVPKLWREYTLEVLYCIQDIVRFCFGENPHAMDTVKLCKKIFSTLQYECSNYNEVSYFKDKSIDKIFQPVIEDVEASGEICNKDSCNFADPSVLAAEFPLLSTLEKHDNKERNCIEVCPEQVSFKTVKECYKDIIEGFTQKWKEEREQNYPKLHADAEAKKKLSNSLAIHEDYIIKVLKEKWSIVEKTAIESGNFQAATKQYGAIYQTLLSAQEKLRSDLKGNVTQRNFADIKNTDSETHDPYYADNVPVVNEKQSIYSSLEQNQNLTISDSQNENDSEIGVKSKTFVVDALPTECNQTWEKDSYLEELYRNDRFVKAKESKNEILRSFDPSSDSTGNGDTNSRTNLTRSFEIEFKSGVANKPAERLISIDNNPESYIDLARLWGSNSRWLSMKYKLLQKGFIKSNEFYTCLPIHRNEFVVANGTFGVIEIGFSKSFNAIAIRRLTEIGWCPERCEDLQKTVEQLHKVKHVNLLRSYVIQDYCGYMFFYTKLCDYNLEEYLAKMKETKQLSESVAKRISFQVVKGLAALHSCNPAIVHGNLKPSNIFIDEGGVLKLAEFGLFKHAYRTNEVVPSKRKIWWPSECHMWYKFLKTYSCTLMSDIQLQGFEAFPNKPLSPHFRTQVPFSGATRIFDKMKIMEPFMALLIQACGILLHIVNSGGVHPYGRNNEEIIHNLETRSPSISVECLELWALLNLMFHPDPCQRLVITEVVNHVYFWSEAKKWDFLKKCLAIANTDYEPLTVPSTVSRKFCCTLEESWSSDATKVFWMASAFMHFPGIEIPYGAWTDSGLGLLRFLNKCRHEHPMLFNKPGWVLKAYPELPSLIYNALRGTQWFQREDLQQFDPLHESDDD